MFQWIALGIATFEVCLLVYSVRNVYSLNDKKEVPPWVFPIISAVVILFVYLHFHFK